MNAVAVLDLPRAVRPGQLAGRRRPLRRSTRTTRGRTPPPRCRTPGCPGPARSARSRCRCPSSRPHPGSTSTNGLPVARPPGPAPAAVISIRNESRSPLFHSPKISPISAGRQPGAAAQQVVGLGDQLHVGVLDAVVHHLHEVPGAVGADVRAARRAVDVRGDLLQDRAERLVRLRRPARHDRRPVQRALLAAGDPAPDEVDALLLQRGLPAAGVLELARCRRR